MANRKKLNVDQIISHIEEDDDIFSADIFITPPDNWQNSDEDSGDEEFASINNLSRHQLLAEANFYTLRFILYQYCLKIVGLFHCRLNVDQIISRLEDDDIFRLIFSSHLLIIGKIATKTVVTKSLQV
ncbi:hypothetical protein ABMA28_008115 [Loxostege sticticalis]|uniref:Uncharacterized protein n=1 Tax=Loxostege sticticalis TaxID=481309 RepID=A0ABD0SG29_LOXSC